MAQDQDPGTPAGNSTVAVTQWNHHARGHPHNDCSVGIAARSIILMAGSESSKEFKHWLRFDCIVFTDEAPGKRVMP
jgi:hypothetical protein